MKKAPLLGATALLLAGAVVFVLREKEALQPSNARQGGMHATQKGEAVPQALATTQDSTALPRTAVEAGATVADPAVTSVLNEYRCAADDRECRANPYAATSEAEAGWLRASGFPTPRERQEAKALSLAQLEQRTHSHQRIAESLYGERLVSDGDMRKAFTVLTLSAHRGNVYALYQLSKMYGDDRHPNKDPLTSKAYLRLAYLTGDYKVSDRLANTFPEFGNPSEQAFVDRRAAELHRGLLQGRVVPRPMSP